jgi:hypothetical protein
VLLLEHDVRRDGFEHVCDQRPAGDDYVAHASASIADVPTADHRAKMLETVAGRCALGQLHSRPNVEAEPVAVLTNELED